MAGARSGPRRVGEAQHGHRRAGVALARMPRRRARPRRCPARSACAAGAGGHRLGEVGGIVALAAVEVRRGLEDELAHRRVRAAQAARMFIVPIDVVLVRGTRRRGGGVDDQARVDHGVDVRRAHDPLEQRVLRPDAHVLRARQLAGRILGADADDHRHGRVALERLRQPAAPVGRQAGDQDPAAACARLRAHPSHTERRRPTMSISSSWIRARMSPATSWTSALSSHGSGPMRSVRTGARKRSLNLAGR